MKLVLRGSIFVATIFLLALSADAIAQQKNAGVSAVRGEYLREGFKNPPQDAKLRCYWWWLNGYTTADTITRELTAMKAKGYAGVLLVDDAASQSMKDTPVGPEYGSAEWMKLYLHALEVASQLGLEVSLSITDGGNVGILGGPGVGAEDGIKLLTYSRTEVRGGAGAEVKLSAPAVVGGYYRQIAVLAYPLRHGSALPGAAGSGRGAIQALAMKTSSIQIGNFSMESADKSIPDGPSVDGEQDAEVKDVVDVSSHTDADGRLHWKFPAGDWEVLRVGYTVSAEKVSTPYGSGYAVDVLDPDAFNHYWDRVLTPILDASKPYIGKSLRYLVTDSWEAYGMNWTPSFRKEFISRRGYDPLPYLPVVAGRIVGSRDTSNRFLADLRRTLADLMTVNYYDHFAARAAAYGLGTHPESGGPHGAPIDALETFRSSAFAQTEFWAASPIHRSPDTDRFFVKEAASAAHIYGKRYVAAEGFSTINMPWSNSLATNLKPAFDRALTEGLNRLFWHEFTSSPVEFGKPGIEYFADTHLDPNVTWWGQAGPVLLAMNRAQFLLQQGKPVADLLYYYGTQVPNFVRLKADDPGAVLPGYEYDVTNEDALLHRMIATGGKLRTPEGVSYRALALPVSRRIALADLIWIDKYVRGGGVVIGLEPVAPDGLIPPAQMKEFKRIASAMWGNCGAENNVGRVQYGAGSVYCTTNSHQAFSAMHITPDFAYNSNDSGVSLDYVHRHAGGTEIYFVRNAKNVAVKATLCFRVRGKVPELWNIDSGEPSSALVYRETGQQTEVPLTIAPYGSVFVVFARPASRHVVEIQKDGAEVYPTMEQGAGAGNGLRMQNAEPGSYKVTLSDGTRHSVKIAAPAEQPRILVPWTVDFPAGWGAPSSITMATLQSWTDSTIEGVRYFSGTATYRNRIDVPEGLLQKNHEIWINLGDVREIATVTVNGKEVGMLWHQPFLVRIDPALHTGDNELAIRVTNLWPNRLIGDKQPGAKVQYTHTNIDAYSKDSPLLPSGLLTPVTLRVTVAGQVQ